MVEKKEKGTTREGEGGVQEGMGVYILLMHGCQSVGGRRGERGMRDSLRNEVLCVALHPLDHRR